MNDVYQKMVSSEYLGSMTNDVSDKNCLNEYSPRVDQYNESVFVVLQDQRRTLVV